MLGRFIGFPQVFLVHAAPDASSHPSPSSRIGICHAAAGRLASGAGGEEADGAAHKPFVLDEAVRQLVGRSLAEVERRLIIGTLSRCSGNRTHAARVLGISIRTLRNKLHDYVDAGFPVPEAGWRR